MRSISKSWTTQLISQLRLMLISLLLLHRCQLNIIILGYIASSPCSIQVQVCEQAKKHTYTNTNASPKPRRWPYPTDRNRFKPCLFTINHEPELTSLDFCYALPVSICTIRRPHGSAFIGDPIIGISYICTSWLKWRALLALRFAITVHKAFGSYWLLLGQTP